jgi:Flp pilus assembly protein TadD
MINILVLLLLSTTAFGQVPSPAASGNEHFAKGEYAEAIAVYERIPQAEKTGAILNRLGVSYHLLNRLKEAETTYKAAIKSAPMESSPHNNLGSLYYSQRKFNDAEKEFRQALQREPENATMRRNLRAARYARENAKKARDVANSITTQKPLLIDQRQIDVLQVASLLPQKDFDNANLHELRANTFLARKMFDDAIIEYKKSIAIDRTNAAAINRLGMAYHQQQKLDEAERQYREAVKLNPYYLEAMNNLGSIEYSRENYERALSQYNKALKIRPNSPTIMQNIGACLFALERFEEGMQVYKRALEIDPRLFETNSGNFGTLIQTTQRNEPELNYHLAIVFANNGDKDRAISYLYKAVEEGFNDFKKIADEKAFAILLADERYTRLMESATTVSR